jgi:hypothetical protein
MGIIMKSISYTVVLIIFTLSSNCFATDWSNSAELPGNIECADHNGHEVCLSDGNRNNIFEVTPSEQQNLIHEGGKHALFYPVDITELKIPYNSMVKFFEEDSRSPLRRFFYKIAKTISDFNSFKDVYSWMGLHDYPKNENEIGPNPIPNMGKIENDPMGVTIFHDSNQAKGMTFSCAACHSNDLFGVKVLGLTNRFPKANELFVLGQKVIKNTPTLAYQAMLGPSRDEVKMFKTMKNAMKSVGLKKPIVIGLDTSLAQVGLSLAKRSTDSYATRGRQYYRNPRKNELDTKPADSKPAVWWNLKYKTRWLSDGSIVSGNPVYTNFLWNEIGRGIDLKNLESWLVNNQDKVTELTSYVFATEAPKYNDFFPRRINIDKAKRGQKLFLKTCSGCHGKYNKGWENEAITYTEQIATTKVWYHKKTPVIDIGTDPYRYEGMRYFAEDLNRLKISKTIGTIVKPQKGYVPPPLVGIWSRWPYFHNNSAPTLYDVITPDFNRPKSYIAVASENIKTDFDIIKNGYPHPSKIREPYKTEKKYYYNTKIKGLSNMGHTKMLVDSNNKEIFTHSQKLELIEFLKTL